MGLYVGFDVVDDFGYLDETEEYGIIPDYTQGCAIFVDTFLRVSQELVPVDTGYLRSTLEADYDDTSCEAWTYCEYAEYQEYGTWKMPAQPYFEQAVLEGLAAAEPYWDQAEQEALEEEMALLEEEEEEEIERSRSQERPMAFGGLNFGSLLGFMISVIATYIVAFIAVTINEIFNFNGGSSARIGVSGGNRMVYMPDIEII